MQTERLKAEFDAPAKEVIAPTFNQLVDDLNADYGASFLGATPIEGRVSEGNVQAILQKLADDLTEVERGSGETSHFHLNKDVLDALSKTDDAHLAFIGNKIPYMDEVVVDENYVHTDINFSETDKNKLDSLENYTLPKATETRLGGVKVDGTTITANNGVISAIGGGGGGEVANAFKTVKVGSTNVTASGEDTFTLVSGNNVTITADATTKEITINSTGGGGGGTSTGDMLMSVYDKNKDGIVDSAETINGLTASIAELNYVDGVTSNIQSQLNSKLEADDVYSKTEVDNKLNGKVSVVSGKGLSTKDYTAADETAVGTLKTALANGKKFTTEDFTTVLKTKLDGIEEGANNYSLPNATNAVLGGVKVDGTSISATNGVISTIKDDGWVINSSSTTQGTKEVTFTILNIPTNKTLFVDPYFDSSSGEAPKNWLMTDTASGTTHTVKITFDELTTSTRFALHYWYK